MKWFVILSPIALAGHAVLWVSFWNQIESTCLPRWLRHRISRFASRSCVLLPPLLVGVLALKHLPAIEYGIAAYYSVCIAIASIVVPRGLVRRLRRETNTTLQQRSSHVECVTAAAEQAPQGSLSNKILFSLRQNQSFELEQNEKELVLPRLAEELDGLTIAHLTDLHFTGKVPRVYFDRAIDMVNEMDADIVAITGDIVDKRECLDWIGPTLGRLKAKHGVYVILGNHDCKLNLPNLRLLLSKHGLIYVGGRLKRLDIHGHPIFIGGNELPWIVPTTDMSECPDRDDLKQLRILLSHSPDQAEWARYFDFDLMLAGHTHGGQFCLPWFGAVVCPSARPLAFASGSFYEPPTMIHVSRGLSAEIPLRLNCRPEITRLVLRCKQPVVSRDQQEYSMKLSATELNDLRKPNYGLPDELEVVGASGSH